MALKQRERDAIQLELETIVDHKGPRRTLFGICAHGSDGDENPKRAGGGGVAAQPTQPVQAEGKKGTRSNKAPPSRDK